MNTWDSLSRVVKDRTTGDVTSTDTRPVRDVYAQGMMAPQYSAMTFPVAAGAHCIYEGELYAAKQDIAASEAWTAAHWDKVQLGAEVAKVGASVADVKSQIGTLSSLHTESKASIVSAINEVNDRFPEGIEAAVEAWLDDHPEATTTVDFEIVTKVFDSVSAMVADLTLKHNDKCRTVGYYEENDGGEGYYYIRAKTESDVADGGLIIDLSATDASNNPLVAELIILDGQVSVKQFGIKDGDDCKTLFTSLCSNDDLQRILFDGNYVCSDTITIMSNAEDRGDGSYARKTTNANPKVLDFTNCTITLTANANLFDIIGFDLDFVGGLFKVDNSVTFTNSIIYFGAGYHSKIRIKDSQMVGNTRYSSTSSTLETNELTSCPAVGCGLKLYGTNVSNTRNATYFCNFENLTIEAFDVGVLIYIDYSSSLVSWITACDFNCLMNYTGKGYVVVGTSTYPRRLSLCGQYQSHGNHNLSSDKFGNILLLCGDIKIDVEIHDDNRCMVNNLNIREMLRLDSERMQRKDIFGIRFPEYYNDVGRFGSCNALSFVKDFVFSDNKKYTEYHAPQEIDTNHMVYHIAHADNEKLAYYLEFGGVPFFKIGSTSIKIEFDLKFTTEDDIPSTAFVGFMVNLEQRKHGRLGNFLTPSFKMKSTSKNCLISAVNSNVITLSKAVEWDTSKTYYCIPEGKEYNGGFYNNGTFPYTESQTGLPKITAFGSTPAGTTGTVTTDTITLDSGGSNLCVNQGLTICTWNSNAAVKASDDNFMGQRLPIGVARTKTANTYAHMELTMNTGILSPSELLMMYFIPYCTANTYGYSYDIYVKDLCVTIV